jgi:LacI family repressor for deo operon, udp, cdd, tsx, nupC, and nupG
LEDIRSSIQSGKLAAGQIVGSEHEMARRTGLSRVSVRRAIGQLISEGLVERRAGKGVFVRDQRTATRTVEIVVPDMSREPWARIVRAAQQAGMDHGVRIQVHDGHQYGDIEMTLRLIETLPEVTPNGAIMGAICHPRFVEAAVRLKLARYPFVLIGEPLRGLDVPTIAADNRAGGYATGEELLRLGHRRIAFVGPLVDSTAVRRMEGLRDAICDAGVPFDRQLVKDLDLPNPLVSWEEPVDRCVRELMLLDSPPTALAFPTDGAAADAYRTLKRLGFSIPDDVSVFGYDEEPICRYLEPPLSSIAQPMEQMGQAAMKLLLERMQDPQAPTAHRILPVRPVVRGSIGPAPQRDARADRP